MLCDGVPRLRPLQPPQPDAVFHRYFQFPPITHADVDLDVIGALGAALHAPEHLAAARQGGEDGLLPTLPLYREATPGDGAASVDMRHRVCDHADGVCAGVLEAGDKPRTQARLTEELAGCVVWWFAQCPCNSWAITTSVSGLHAGALRRLLALPCGSHCSFSAYLRAGVGGEFQRLKGDALASQPSQTFMCGCGCLV